MTKTNGTYLKRMFNKINKLNLLGKYWARYAQPEAPPYRKALTPTDEVDIEGTYSGDFDFAIKDETVFNIALTGGYGVGKSSVLKSYLKHRKDKNKWLTISLAAFEKVTVEIENQPQESCPTNKEVENSILQQLLFHGKNPLPFSRLHELDLSSPMRSPMLYFWAGFTLVLAWLAMVWPIPTEVWPMLTEVWPVPGKSIAVLLTWEWAAFGLPLLISITASVLVVLDTIRYLSKRGFGLTSVKVLGTEVNLLPCRVPSSLSSNLDEILYFFKNSEFKFVVFEDLDRFAKQEIFTKLREINTLINQSLYVGKKIIFIYALNDSNFSSKDRTKFFDYVIPVVPYLHYTNAYELFERALRKTENYSRISNVFLREISVYFDEFRVLQNVVNEYGLYQSILKENCVSLDKLLAIIVYKNLCPGDFYKLLEKNGELYKLIDTQREMQQENIRRLDDEIKAKEEVLEVLRGEHLNSLKELRAVYIAAIICQKDADGCVSVYVNDNPVQTYNLLENDAALEYMSATPNKQIQVAMSQGNRRYLGTFESIEKTIAQDLTYIQRRNKLTQLLGGTEAKVSKDITELRSLKHKHRFATLAETLTLNSEFLNEPEFQALRYMLLNGYIDEHYSQYLCHFHPGYISASDNQFLRAIMAAQTKSKDLILDNAGACIGKLSEGHFNTKYCLNYQLISELVAQRDAYPDKYQAFISKARDGESDWLKFMPRLLLDEPTAQVLWVALLEDNYDLTNRLSQANASSGGHERIWIRNYIYYLNHDNSNPRARRSRLKTYIKQNIEEFVEIPETVKNTVFENLMAMDVKFEELMSVKNSPGLLTFCRKNNLYEFSPENQAILLFNSEVRTNTEISTTPISDLLASKQTDMIEYAEEHWNQYVSSMSAVESTLDEPIECIMGALRDIGDEPVEGEMEALQNKLVRALRMPVKDILKVDQVYKDLFFVNLKVEPTWSNVLAFYEQYEDIPDCLEVYLNSPGIIISLGVDHEGLGELDEILVRKFIDSVTENENIQNEYCVRILEALPFHVFLNKERKYAADRLETFLNAEVLGMSIDNIEIVSKILPKSAAKFIHLKFDQFVEIYNESLVPEKIIHEVIMDCTNSQFFKLIGVVLDHKNYVEQPLKSERVKSTIDRIAIRISEVIDNESSEINRGLESLTSSTLLTLMKSTISEELKTKIIISVISCHDEMMIGDFLVEVSDSLSKITPQGANIRIEKSEINIKLVRELKNIGYIADYSYDKHREDIVIQRP